MHSLGFFHEHQFWDEIIHVLFIFTNVVYRASKLLSQKSTVIQNVFASQFRDLIEISTSESMNSNCMMIVSINSTKWPSTCGTNNQKVWDIDNSFAVFCDNRAIWDQKRSFQSEISWFQRKRLLLLKPLKIQFRRNLRELWFFWAFAKFFKNLKGSLSTYRKWASAQFVKSRKVVYSFS